MRNVFRYISQRVQSIFVVRYKYSNKRAQYTNLFLNITQPSQLYICYNPVFCIPSTCQTCLSDKKTRYLPHGKNPDKK